LVSQSASGLFDVLVNVSVIQSVWSSQSVSLSVIRSSVGEPVIRFDCQSFFQSIWQWVSQSTCLSVNQSVCLSVSQSVYTSSKRVMYLVCRLAISSNTCFNVKWIIRHKCLLAGIYVINWYPTCFGQ
jgi:hypothetical protein